MALCDNVLHTGVLFKRGSGANNPFGRTNWKTRYFVLTPTTLAYYTYEGGQWKGELEFVAKPTRKLLTKTPKAAPRTTIEVMPADSKKTGRSRSTIWRIAVNAPKRRLLLAASSEWEMNVWVDKLQLALRVAYTDAEKLQQRVSLPASSTMLTPKVFVTDFSCVHTHRQRHSIIGNNAIDSNEWSELSEVDAPTSHKSTPSSTSSSLLSPQEPGAFDSVHMSSSGNSSAGRFTDSAMFAAPDSNDSIIHVMGSSLTPPPSSNATTRMLAHQQPRLSLPIAIETHVFTDADLQPQQPPMPSIVDFQNFARSRRRLSIDSNSARFRFENAQRFSVDAATAYRPSGRAEPAELMYEDSDDEDNNNETSNNDTTQQQRTLMQQQLQPRSTVETPVGTVGSNSVRKAIESDAGAQRQRFARVRRWFKRSNSD